MIRPGMRWTRCGMVLWMVVLGISFSAMAANEDFSTRMMRATVKVGGDTSMATGFLISRPVAGEAGKTVCILTTAAHVLEKLKGEEATIWFRVCEAEGVYKKQPVKFVVRQGGKDLWTKHPSADILAMAVALPKGVDNVPVPLEMMADEAAMRRCAIHPGDTLMCIGYPHRFDWSEAGFGVLRAGAIASFPLVPVKANPKYLMSFNTFEGDSGAPVYLADPQRLCEGKTENVQLIMGMVLAQHFIDEDVKMMYQTQKVRHRLGLATVVHAALIRETIEKVEIKP